MSNKHADNNDKQTATVQQQSDEAFINELYEEVSDENQSQPSELLDQRIINAAHKAIQKTKKTKVKSNITWYSSLATAASLTLVISLVILQKSNVLPSEPASIPIESRVILQKTIKPANDSKSITDQEITAEKIDFQESADYSAISRKMAKSMVNTSKISNTVKVENKDRLVRATQYEKNTRLNKQKSAEQMMTASPVFITRFNSIEQHKAQEHKAEIMNLSIEQFQQYKRSNKALDSENQWLWSFSSENDIEYIIVIFHNSQAPLEYRLDKSIFKIIDAPQHDLRKLPLNNILLSTITILHTNK